MTNAVGPPDGMDFLARAAGGRGAAAVLLRLKGLV